MIDRRRLTKRNAPHIDRVDYFSPLSVGNGKFAFTADVSGLQTFSRDYEDKMPVCTMSNWGWHTFPEPEGCDISSIRPEMYDTFGRQVGYFTNARGQEDIFNYLRENPHRFHLGNIGLLLLLSSGKRAQIDDLKDIDQTLDLWRGIIKSRYTIEGTEVYVETVCDPKSDTVGVKIRSALIPKGRLCVELKFPYGSPAMCGADWNKDYRHSSSIISQSSRRIELARSMDGDQYFVTVSAETDVIFPEPQKHVFIIKPAEEIAELSFAVRFSKEKQSEPVPDVNGIFSASARFWENFWSSGGAIDFSGCIDPRAQELERRVVLSQYLTAIQCSGSIPPQETGLTCNSWYGKAHLEMHWWHAAHFALWSRPEMLENSMWWYRSVMPKAEAIAGRQGYKGVRWQKMVSPDGADSPSKVAPLLIWQQPHPIFYAELLYRAKKDSSILDGYKDIVFRTAEFMADFIHYENGRYVLGAPLIPASENNDGRDTLNPTYELEYWYQGLYIAQQWKERLGDERVELWDDILKNISQLPQKNGVYLEHENCPDTYTSFNKSHPCMLNAFGALPGALVDREIMKNTLNMVLDKWQMNKTWGWDYPLMAMCAARLGEPEKAIECLLLDTPKNQYLENGHNYQRPNLPLYLPANGGLLTAIAMMAAGWDGLENGAYAPGFPKDGKWNIKYEGILRYR